MNVFGICLSAVGIKGITKYIVYYLFYVLFFPHLQQYHYQEDDSPPLDQGFPRLTNEVRAPELVHVSEKNLSEIENVHGYVSHAHISPLKVSLTNICHEVPTWSFCTLNEFPDSPTSISIQQH